jgi:hypothetical protein
MICTNQKPGECFALRRWFSDTKNKKKVQNQVYIFIVDPEDTKRVSVIRNLNQLAICPQEMHVYHAKELWVTLRAKGFIPCDPYTGDVYPCSK